MAVIYRFKLLVEDCREAMAEISSEAAASAPSAGPPDAWADVEPAQKKQKLGGQRVKWVGELAFVQKGPQDKTVYCGYTQMGVDMKEKVHCFTGCKGECANRWECPCPCHVLQRSYDEAFAEDARAKKTTEQSEDGK